MHTDTSPHSLQAGYSAFCIVHLPFCNGIFFILKNYTFHVKSGLGGMVSLDALLLTLGNKGVTGKGFLSPLRYRHSRDVKYTPGIMRLGCQDIMTDHLQSGRPIPCQYTAH